MKRTCGVLLPISSLPSRYGIGAFSRQAYEFVDFLKKAGQTYWQILPLGPTSFGDSPYQSYSTFAGNPYFIDLEALTEEGYLTEKDCRAYDFGTDPSYVDYEKMFYSRFKILRRAYRNFQKNPPPDLDSFRSENQFWLEDYALFMAVKEKAFGGRSWSQWDSDIKRREPDALKKYRAEYKDEIGFYVFQQYCFAAQWKKLKSYANSQGILIVGDIPIYVAFDSADTWSNPALFQLDQECSPTAVAGCPPDFFAATGQLWGNPLYRWDYHKKTGYEWWMKRISYCYELYDVLRIDHFRGFDEYYSIPYGDPTAEFGHWEKGPGYDFFDVMKKTLGHKQVIAEDLGFLTPTVIRLVKKTGYPGMKIIQFAFDSNETNEYLPHSYTRNSVVYTGTHDNDTTLGWYRALSRQSKANARNYLGIKSGRDIVWHMIRLASSSVADTCIIPMQDYLELGAEARINIPSTVGINWKWRMLPDACTDALAEKIYQLNRCYGRV